ncbi:MAG: hypothetical protein AAF727_16560, partial [Pseudomonadota bacterium]
QHADIDRMGVVMSRYPEKPAAPRSVAPSGARVLGDLSAADAMEEARRRRERALAVGIPANSDADVLIAPPILGATVAAAQVAPPPSIARRAFDGLVAAGAFLLGAAIFAPIAGYAALGKLPFEFGEQALPQPEEPAFSLAVPTLPTMPDGGEEITVPVQAAASGGNRPPPPPILPDAFTQDGVPTIAFAGSVFATALTTSPSAASPTFTDDAFQVAALSSVTRDGPPLLEEAQVEARLPSVQHQVFDASVFIHAPQSARIAASAAEAVLQDIGLSARLTDPVSFGISVSNVRYFHPSDRAAAAEVARLLNAEIRDFTDFRPSPRVGTVEVWIAGRSSVPTLRAVPVPTISTLPIPEALAPLPEASRRSGFISRLLGGGDRTNPRAFQNEREDSDDDNRSSSVAAASEATVAETAKSETDSIVDEVAVENHGPDEQAGASDSQSAPEETSDSAPEESDDEDEADDDDGDDDSDDDETDDD